MLPNLTVRQLQTFREVMRTGSFSEASRVLGRTQPAISTMIANIEAELGFALFLREHGRVIPCPEAHYFLEEAEQVLERLERAQRVMREFSTRERGHLRIAVHPAASGYFMPDILADFLQDKPRIKADVMMRTSQVVEDLIASQEFDIGLAETPRPRASIEIENYRLRCVVALPQGAPLAEKAMLTPEDLSGSPLAMLFDEHPITRATQDAFNRAGATLDRRFTLRTFLPSMRLVGAGLCVAIVDRITAMTYPSSGIVFREFEPAINAEIALLMPAHRPASQLTHAFRALLRQRLDALNAPVA
jgi:DNA-binding transcriptional LysR family regulator